MLARSPIGGLLKNPNGDGLAEDCCCDGSACCPGVTLPDELTATISNKTGTCSCLPDTVILTRDPLPPTELDVVERWFGDYTECTGCSIVLTCMRTIVGDVTTYRWELQTASCIAVATLVSIVCDPLVMVWDCDNTLGGVTNCTDTFTVTITL